MCVCVAKASNRKLQKKIFSYILVFLFCLFCTFKKVFEFNMDLDLNINLDSLRDLENTVKIDVVKFQKMLLIFNAIEQGWSVKKKRNTYTFTKKHENKKQVFEDSYLMKFMKSTLDINKIIQ